MKSWALSIFIIFGLSSSFCVYMASSSSSVKNNKIRKGNYQNRVIEDFRRNTEDSLRSEYVDLMGFIPDLKIDLRYATMDNFTKQVLYSSWKRAYANKGTATKLNNAMKILKSIDPALSLLIYDAARPLSVQKKMWLALDSIPPKERIKFLSPPSSLSLHNFGCALDITICTLDGIPLDMGAGYDDMRKIAYPSYENYYLSCGLLSQQQVNNRKLLRKVMYQAGFTGISTEWWHFNAFSKEFAKQHFQVINEEDDVFNK